MKGKRGVSLIVVAMIALALVAALAGCVVEEEVNQPGSFTVTLWEGNSYALALGDADSLFTSMPSREGYVFGGWFYDDGTFSQPVTVDNIKSAPAGTVVYAKWTVEEDPVLVTFYNYQDDVVLYRAYVAKGSDLSSWDIVPTFRPADDKYEYVFKGWDKDLTSIVADTEVRPVYDEIARTYDVTFIVNGVAVDVVSVPYGGSVAVPAAEDIDAYLPRVNGKKVTFTGWNRSANTLNSITEDIEVSALYSYEDIYFNVTFNYGNGLSDTQRVLYGEDATPPTQGLDKPDGAGVDHVFVGWDNNYCFVTEDRVINAVYDDHTDWYRVDFYNGDVLYCRRYVPYGEAAQLPEAPVKASDAQYNYTFDRWLDADGRTADLTSIDGDVRVYADFVRERRSYEVVFYVEGKAISTQSVVTGTSAVVPAPEDVKAAIAAEEGVIKTFITWDKAFNSITSDTAVNAIVERKYETRTVTFVWGLDGEHSDVQKVTYGTAAKAPDVDVMNIECEDGVFVFDGWQVQGGVAVGWSSVKADMTVRAQYRKNPKYVIVRFLDAYDEPIGEAQTVEYGKAATAPAQAPQKAADAQYTYEFEGWDVAFEKVTSDLVVRPQFTQIPRAYSVTFVDADGVQIGDAQTVEYGGAASAPQAPAKQPSVQYEYTFDKWVGGDLNNIVGDTEFSPTYAEKLRKYNVTFVYGKVDEPESGDYHEEIQQVEYGMAADAPEEEAAAYTGTNTTEYQFAGWETSNYLNVTGNMTVKAVYNKYDRHFEVSFRHENGALLIPTQHVSTGEKVVLPDAENIVKQQDVQYTYAFDGWTYDDGKFISDEDFAAIADGNIDRDYDLTAHFTEAVRSYSVIFYDDDRTTVLSEQQVEYGKSATEPEAPIKEQTVQWVYTFGGWDSEAWKNITGDTVVYATYSQDLRKYNVTFVYGKVDEPESGDYHEEIQQVEYGMAADAPEEEAAAYTGTNTTEYQFAGWETSNYLNVTGNMTVKAIYRTYDKYFNVTFRDESGALLSAPQYVRYGKDEVVLPDAENIVKQQDVQYTYAFDGWTYDDGKFISDEDFAAIAGGMTVDRDYELTAHFAATVRKYTVIFYDDDRTTVLSEQQVEYGTSAAEPEAPTKEQTVQWVYEFSGWDSDKWTNIVGDTVVYATYSQALRKYDVTFVYGNVDDESSGDYRTTTIQVEYGKIPTVPEGIDTTRPSTAKYDYTFSGWNGLLAVSGDMTVTADYVATIRNYMVTFYNMTTGALEGENEMPYGSWIERTMSAGGYVFDSWYTKEGDDYTALPTKDDVLSAGGEGHVTGDMTLYGNLVMEGITFDSNNNISGYTGSNSFVVIPTYANRQKVGAINGHMFQGRTQEEIEAVYLPLGVQVSANAFRSMDNEPYDVRDKATWDRIYDEDVVKTLIVYCQAEDDGGLDATRDQFDSNWDSNSIIGAFASGGISSVNKYFNVKGIETIGDYNYVLLADNTAIIQRFVNGTKKYVEVPTGSVTVGSGENAVEYRITELAGSAFRGMSNVETVFIANEWKDLKVGRYVFSGLTATIYLAIEKPGLNSTIPGIGSSDVAKWNVGWANTASGDEGEITLEWNCDGLHTQDEVTYLLRSNGEAIAISQEFTFLGGLTKLTVPETLTVNEKTYTVTEIGDQLFKDEMLLTDVSIPGTIKRIGEQAFFGTNLKSLTLAEGLEEIGNLAFAMNTSLTYVYIPESCETIGYFAFAGANNAELFMGRKSAPTGSGLIGYKVGWNTTVDLTGLDLSSIGSIVTSLVGSGTTLPTYWNAVGKTEVDISGTGWWEVSYQVRLIFVVTKDGNARVISATTAGANIGLKLKSFNIPSTVTYNDVVYTVTAIDGGAFADWELDTLGIPSTVTSIASNAFSSIKTINTDAAQPTDTALPAGWEFDATNITINYGQTLS